MQIGKSCPFKIYF